MATSLEERFWSKVDKDGPTMPHMDTNCWVWTAAKSPKGYGLFWNGDRPARAHRVSLSFGLGRMPMPCALHACDNAACVRPDHLREGTHSENERESYARGCKKILKGETHPRSKLTATDIQDIRKRFAQGETQAAIARSYAVNSSHISDIIHRKRWAHIT